MQSFFFHVQIQWTVTRWSFRFQREYDRWRASVHLERSESNGTVSNVQLPQKTSEKDVAVCRKLIAVCFLGHAVSLPGHLCWRRPFASPTAVTCVALIMAACEPEIFSTCDRTGCQSVVCSFLGMWCESTTTWKRNNTVSSHTHTYVEFRYWKSYLSQ